MNVKQFKKRWLNHYVEPELFYMPVKKKEKEDQEFIFEVTGVTSININYFVGMGYTPSIPFEYDYSPFPKDTNITNHFSCNRNNYSINTINYGMIERPITEDGEEITKEKFPEYFTDWSIHDVEHGKYSENMILPKNPKVEIDWGDGNVDIYDTPQFNNANVTIDGKTTVYKYFTGYKNLYSGHKYEEAGIYIIKIKGFLPSLILPNGTTRIINWGDIGLRSIYNICSYCSSTIKDFGKPKNLEHVVTSSSIFTSQNSCATIDISFIDNMPSLVNASNMFNYANVKNIPDNAFTNSKFLCYLSYCFSYISNEITVGNNFAKDLPELRQVDFLFDNTKIKRIGDNALQGCKKLFYTIYMFPTNISKVSLETVGTNFMRGCTSLTSVYQLFYYQYKLKKIGEGLLRECPYIRSSQNMFYYCDVLQKIPDNLFYDLKVNSDFVRNRFCFNSFLYKGYNDLWNKPFSELQEYITEIGSNMFSSDFFANGGELYFNSQFSNTFNCSMQVEQNIYRYEYFSLYKGAVPDLWNYMDNLYNTATATEPLSKGDYYFNFYGYQRNDWTEITGYNYMNNTTNYESIPKPSGNLIRSHIPTNDQLWLSCTYWNEYRISVNIQYPQKITLLENSISYNDSDIVTQIRIPSRFIIISPDGTETQNIATFENFSVEFTQAYLLNVFEQVYSCSIDDIEIAHATGYAECSIFALPFITKTTQTETSYDLDDKNGVYHVRYFNTDIKIEDIVNPKLLAHSSAIGNRLWSSSTHNFFPVDTFLNSMGGYVSAIEYGNDENIFLPIWKNVQKLNETVQNYYRLVDVTQSTNSYVKILKYSTPNFMVYGTPNYAIDFINNNNKTDYPDEISCHRIRYNIDYRASSNSSGSRYSLTLLSFTNEERDIYRNTLP